jgi:plastocyanin
MKFLKNSIYVLFFVLLLNSCSSTPEKYVPQVYNIQIKDMKFQPAELIVHKGDTVVWTNLDMTAHDVTDQTGNTWSSKPIASGQSWKMAITKKENYYCSIHKVMTGKILLDD